MLAHHKNSLPAPPPPPLYALQHSLHIETVSLLCIYLMVCCVCCLHLVLVQGLKVVELLRSFMAKMPENVKAIADPDGFAEKVGPNIFCT